MATDVIALIPRVDPGTAETEERFSVLIDRLRRVRIQTRIVSAQLEEFARQFVDDDLYELVGPARGKALDRAGRRERLKRMATVHEAYLARRGEEAELVSLLARLEFAIEGRAEGDPEPGPSAPKGSADAPPPPHP